MWIKYKKEKRKKKGEDVLGICGFVLKNSYV